MGADALRRRAADARHRPRADVAAEDAGSRRALHGPFAGPGAGDLAHRRDIVGRGGPSCWSSRTPRWRSDWPIRLCAGDRKYCAARPGARAARQRACAAGLSWWLKTGPSKSSSPQAGARPISPGSWTAEADRRSCCPQGPRAGRRVKLGKRCRRRELASSRSTLALAAASPITASACICPATARGLPICFVRGSTYGARRARGSPAWTRRDPPAARCFTCAWSCVTATPTGPDGRNAGKR